MKYRSEHFILRPKLAHPVNIDKVEKNQKYHINN